jgi:hypothetical protein
MSAAKEKSQKLTQFWKCHIEQWAESGLSQNAYCKKNDLRPNRFTYWKTKFKNQILPTEFVQVPETQIRDVLNLPVQTGLKLNTDTGFQIEVPDGFSQATLVRVLEVLGRI